MKTIKFKNGKFNPSAMRKAGLSGKTHMVPCPGEAHNPEVCGMIDNCGICAPNWAEVEIPVEHKDLDVYQSFLHAS